MNTEQWVLNVTGVTKGSLYNRVGQFHKRPYYKRNAEFVSCFISCSLFFAATQFSIPNPHNSLLLHLSARICTRNMGHIQQSKLGGEMWATKKSLNLKAARCILPRQYFSVKLEISNLLIFRCWKDMENIRCHAKFIYIFIVYKILQLLKLVLYEGNLNTTGHGTTLISKAVGILY